MICLIVDATFGWNAINRYLLFLYIRSLKIRFYDRILGSRGIQLLEVRVRVTGIIEGYIPRQ